MGMSFRATVAVIADLVLGGVLLLLFVTRLHLTVPTKGGSAIVPSYWLYAVLLFAMAAVTAWWLLGRRRV